MDYSVVVQLIGSVGFPIVMCGWFALRNEKTLQATNTAITELTKVVAVLTAKFGDDAKNE